jgi:hypothetical protein
VPPVSTEIENPTASRSFTVLRCARARPDQSWSGFVIGCRTVPIPPSSREHERSGVRTMALTIHCCGLQGRGKYEPTIWVV